MHRGNDILKIYDDDLTHIGHATREQVHREGLLHQVAHLWMFQRKSPSISTGCSDSDCEHYILFQQRSLNRDLYPGKYDLIQTTHFDPAESYEDGIARSMEYHLGARILKRDVIHVGSTRQRIDQGDYHDNALVQVFAMFVKKALFIMPDTEEIIKVRAADFFRFINGDIPEIDIYSLDDIFLKKSTPDEWWLRKDEFFDVMEPYFYARIEECLDFKKVI